MTVYELAREGYRAFETAQRNGSDETYTRCRDDAPQWVTDLVYAAHDDGDMLPDDWRYECIRSALGWIADNEPDPLEDDSGEFADSEVDVYTGARFAWLSSNLSRQGYVDDATAEFGPAEDIASAIGMGQYMEAQEVYSAVCRFLEERAEEDEDAEE